MIAIDKLTGVLKVDNKSFKSTLKSSDLEGLHGKDNAELLIKNERWSLYRMSNLDSGESILLFQFYEEELKTIQLALGMKYVNLDMGKQRKLIKRRLKEIGGESTYLWGSIELNEDIKAGFVSILIKYN